MKIPVNDGSGGGNTGSGGNTGGSGGGKPILVYVAVVGAVLAGLYMAFG